MGVGMRLTKLGKHALALAQTGEILRFSRVAIGSGIFDYDTESVYDLTELREFQMWLPITDYKVVGDGTVSVTAYLSNAELAKGFACREHGIYCYDPLTGDEILYAYKNCGDDYDFIPSNTGNAFKNIFVSYECEISDAENITAVLNLDVAYINTEDFRAHVESSHPHLNTPNHYDDVAETTALWATDNGDNHLHKISVENLKNTLGVTELENRVADSVSDEEKIYKASNELGLNANLLLIEDFQDEIVTDFFKSKVTSAAEHGNLLGIETPEKLRTGGEYILSDNVSAEVVKILSVTKNNSGYHAKLTRPIANTYSKDLYLYRTTPAPCKKLELNYSPAEKFEGVGANLVQNLELDKYFEITGDGFFDGESFTLA